MLSSVSVPVYDITLSVVWCMYELPNTGTSTERIAIATMDEKCDCGIGFSWLKFDMRFI